MCVSAFTSHRLRRAKQARHRASTCIPLYRTRASIAHFAKRPIRLTAMDEARTLTLVMRECVCSHVIHSRIHIRIPCDFHNFGDGAGNLSRIMMFGAGRRARSARMRLEPMNVQRRRVGQMGSLRARIVGGALAWVVSLAPLVVVNLIAYVGLFTPDVAALIGAVALVTGVALGALTA